jgi:hypothetical protein
MSLLSLSLWGSEAGRYLPVALIPLAITAIDAVLLLGHWGKAQTKMWIAAVTLSGAFFGLSLLLIG